MSAEAPGGRGAFRWLANRVGNPLTWSNADKCLLVAIAVAPFAAWHTAILFHVAAHPDRAPYYAPDFARRSAMLHAVGWFGGWGVIAVAALILRRHRPGTTMLVTATVQFYCCGCALLSYAVGAYTSLLVSGIGLSGYVVGLILFERRQVLRGVATFFVVFGALTATEQAGLIPYGPLLREAPFAAGHLHPSWLTGLGLLSISVMVFGLVLIYFIILQWREQHEKLVATSEQLGRANDFISRFVAAQVAEEVRAGNFSSVERHDRRRLTIFFSDIRGFSATADRIEPEELSEMLNEYFDEMMLIAERYGATVDKFIGDGMMIFFGAPVGPHEPDHAQRAVRMAMEMQWKMGELRPRWRARGMEEFIDIRIGINTGVANVGAFGARGRMDYTAIGRQVNLAARLQVACEPGRILVSHSTWLLVADAIRCTPKGEIEVKGFHHPVRVYEVEEAFQPKAQSGALVREAG